MIAAALNKTERSRWMDWQPKPRIIATPPPNEPTKPSKPSSVGFVGPHQGESFIIRGQLPEQVVPLDDTTAAKLTALPHGIRRIEWKLKEPPVAIETCAVVVDTALFAKSTLEQLRIALTQPKRWVGWSVPQLLDRLAQVGVLVTLETISKETEGA